MSKTAVSKTLLASAAAKSKQDTRLTEALNLVLADTYALMGLTHFAHWNVEGPGFFSLHQAFQDQYQELFAAADEVAERVRALGQYAVGGLGQLAKTAGLPELSAPLPQAAYVSALIAAHEKTMGDAMRARDLAADIEDLESQDLMIKRIQIHQKTIWMLSSFLKG